MLRNISIIVLFSFLRTIDFLTSHNVKLFVKVICSRYAVLYLTLQYWSCVGVKVEAWSSVWTENLIDIVIERCCFLQSSVWEDLHVSNKGYSFSSTLLGNRLYNRSLKYLLWAFLTFAKNMYFITLSLFLKYWFGLKFLM